MQTVGSFMQRVWHREQTGPSVGERYVPDLSLGVASLNELMTESESTEEQESRLNKLAGFQLMMIKHAMQCMSYFPGLNQL